MRTILVISGESSLYETCVKTTELARDVRVIQAKDGVSGCSMAKNERMMLICMDYDVKGHSGSEMILRIKHTQLNMNTPICVVIDPSQVNISDSVEDALLYFFRTPLNVEEFSKKTLAIVNGVKTDAIASRNTKFLNIFISAILHTLSTLTGVKNISPGRGTLVKDGNLSGTGDINGIISIRSESINGQLVMSFPNATFLKMASAIFKKELLEVTPQVYDAAAEITNIVLGQSKKDLSDNGFQLEKSLPKIVKKSEAASIFEKNTPTIVIPIGSDMGDFSVSIAVKYN